MSNTLYQIEKNVEDVRQTVLTNCVKMLNERGVQTFTVDNVLKQQSDDLIYNIGDKIVCKIIFHKITAINKSYGMMEFVENYKDSKKIIVVKEINKRVLQHAKDINSNLEVFMEKELMINLIDHELVPKHKVLSKEKGEEVLKSYIAKKKNMPKILSNDPVSRYYGVKPGDIFRIVRPSEKSGLVPTYRLVVKGSL